MKHPYPARQKAHPARSAVTRRGERGNVLLMVLIAIALIAALTAVISKGGDDNTAIDKETLALRASEVQRYASELERGIKYIAGHGAGEEDFRFAVPTDPATDYGNITATPGFQMFSPEGGGAAYRLPPAGIQTSAGGVWEFYGNTAVPQAGSAKAELIAVLPNVTQAFCQRINQLNAQTNSQPADGGGNIHDSTQRFDGGTLYRDTTPNALTAASFTKLPPLQACVQSGSVFHFYHVLYAR